jgi:hypothetical protein
MLAVTVHSSVAFALMPARNATPVALNSSSGHSGSPFTSGLFDARARYDAAFTRKLPANCTFDGTTSTIVCANTPPLR